MSIEPYLLSFKQFNTETETDSISILLHQTHISIVYNLINNL